MIEIREMGKDEIEDVLKKVGYCHFACTLDDRPYIVPINYAYRTPNIYIYTTKGKKSKIIDENPRVCLQVEEVINNGDWRSVVFNGIAKRIVDPQELEDIIGLIVETNPPPTPATGIRWENDWIRENQEMVYRIEPEKVTGRYADSVKITSAKARF